MKKIGIVAVSAITLCWAMYEVSSDNTNPVQRNELGQKAVTKNFSASAKNEKFATQMLLAQTKTINSSPVCQYHFDATQEDYDLWNSEHPDYFPMKIFSVINGQKFSSPVNSRLENEYGYVDYMARSKASLNLANDIGDFSIPNTGIIAFEMELKVPTVKVGNSSYISNIDFTGVTNNGYTVRSNYGFHTGTYDPDFGENPPTLNYSVAYRLSDNSGPDHPYFKSQNMINNTNEYQRLGIYINQNTKQVGFILNGVDQGYQSNLPAPLANIRFYVMSGIAIYSDQLFGQELSNELITDRNALQFNYPQGTTDMCGNAI
ncbi:DUF4882 domain-containing protein [Acinetobacter sp. XH1741]|uniref:DUF4882 domain-containing protein n=1 Tax=unclassified Acinetobacter TaxID=196816 RepID=UPI0032B451C0